MEKSQKRSKLLKDRQKLPSLPQTKSHMQLKHLPVSDLLGSTDRLKDLRKLYFQYKSNANILNNSPYYSNRQQQKQVVAYIHSHKFDIDPHKLDEISHKFAMEGYQARKSICHQLRIIKVKLMVLGHVLDFSCEVGSIAELDGVLKMEFAIQEFKMSGSTKRAEMICGFESVNENSITDYQLSLKNQPVLQEKYYLRPIFVEVPRGTVKLSDFKLVRCLGSGGFSLVYLARDNWTGQYLALKMIDKKFILESQRETIVENERYVLGELQSQFVTGLKYCFETKNHFAFLVEYCPGGELFYQLKKVKKMNEDQAKFYFLQILIGLDYIHQKNIIYRDLKPQNLLIAADGHIKIADFGLAKPILSDQRKVAYSFCGSPEYMAPEMLLKSGHSFTLDYYCLGALLYELVIGIPPYYSLNHDEIYNGILNQELTFPPHAQLSEQIKSLLRGLLEKNPSKRLGHLYGIKEILIHPWVGRINRTVIQQKKLTPPFLPDLTAFNFDESDLQQRNQEMAPKIEQDLKNSKFQTHFNNQFYFEDLALSKLRTERPFQKIKKNRKLLSNSKESVKQNRTVNRSVEARPKKMLRRILSQKEGLRV